MFGGALLRRSSQRPTITPCAMKACYEVRGGHTAPAQGMSPTRRQVDNKKTLRPSTPPFDFDRTYSHHRKQMRPLGGLPPAGQPSPPSRAHAYSAGEGRVIHSTARGGDRAHRRRWRRRADGGRPLAVLGRLVRRHPPRIDALQVAARATAASHTALAALPPVTASAAGSTRR